MKKPSGLSIDFIAVLLSLGLLAVIAVPGFVRGGPGRLNGIFNNLRIIEGAKEQWALEHKQSAGVTPRISDLAPYLRNRRLPTAIAKETYEINPLGIAATARLTHKVELYEAGCVVTVNGNGDGQLAE